MRKLLREGVDFGKVAEKAVAIIKGKGYDVVMFTLDGMETSDPEEARRLYIKDPNFMVTIDEDASLIRINKNSNVELSEIEASMKQLKNLAKEYMMKSELKVFGKEITPKDFAYQAKKLRDSKMNGINEASFSRMHGHKKTSYQTLESTKLIVRHRRPVDEEVHGARSRQIKSIFIERAGERFKFPHNHLAGARAMARHIDEGGEMHDAVGSYIIESTANLMQLVEFANYARRNKLINEESEDVVKIVRENIAAYKRELQKFQGATSYAKMCEQVANREGSEIEESETGDLKDMFTVRKFDEKMTDTLPLIKKLVTEKNAWRSMIEEASEGEFAVTSTENLIEGDAIEFDSPTQKLGYKIRTLSERVIEESELSKFVHKIGNKMVEGTELSKFEKSVMRNVLENIVVAEEVAEEDGLVDKLDEYMTDFERKMKLLEYDLDWEDEEAEEELYKGFYGNDDDELRGLSVHDGNYEERDCEDCDGGGTDYLTGEECGGCGGSGKGWYAPLGEDRDKYKWADGAPPKIGCSECGDFSMDLQDKHGNDFHYVCNTCGNEQTEHLPPTKEQWYDCEECEGEGADPMTGEVCHQCGGEGRFLEGLNEEPGDWDHGLNFEGPQRDADWDAEMRRGESEAGCGMGYPMCDEGCPACGSPDWDVQDSSTCDNCGYSEDSMYAMGEDFERDRPARDYSSLAGHADCPSCHGTGANTGRKMLTHGWNCPDCKGTGKTMESVDPEDFMDECPACEGTGKEYGEGGGDDCEKCDGNGYV